jgi:hypothetical protein
VKWIALVALIIAIISLIPASTTIGVEPQGSTRISGAGGSHPVMSDKWSTLIVSTVHHPWKPSQGPLPRTASGPGFSSITPDPGEHRVAEKDTSPEPGTILLFGMGLIAMTYGLKFRMFKR